MSSDTSSVDPESGQAQIGMVITPESSDLTEKIVQLEVAKEQVNSTAGKRKIRDMQQNLAKERAARKDLAAGKLSQAEFDKQIAALKKERREQFAGLFHNPDADVGDPCVACAIKAYKDAPPPAPDAIDNAADKAKEIYKDSGMEKAVELYKKYKPIIDLFQGKFEKDL